MSGPALRRIDTCGCCIQALPPCGRCAAIAGSTRRDAMRRPVTMVGMKTRSELLKAARTQVPEVTPADVNRQSPRPVILDVRDKNETDAGMLPGARHVPRGFLELRIEETVPDHDADIVLYCASGTRSLLAGTTLREMGYTRV